MLPVALQPSKCIITRHAGLGLLCPRSICCSPAGPTYRQAHHSLLSSCDIGDAAGHDSLQSSHKHCASYCGRDGRLLRFHGCSTCGERLQACFWVVTAVFVCNDSLHMQIACLKSQCRTECSEKLRVCLHTAGRRRFTSVTTFSHPHVCGVCGLL